MLHIIESLDGFGGTPRKLLYLAKCQDVYSYKMAFLCFGHSSLAHSFQEIGATVRNANTISPPRLVAEAIDEARRVDADVICTHYTRPLTIGCFAARRCGIPLVHNEHSSPNYRKGLGRFLTKVCVPRADTIICNSEYTLRQIIATYPSVKNKVSVIYNPVETRDVVKNHKEIRMSFGLLPDDVLIGHVGGMIPSRDHATLIRAYAQVLKTYPTSKLALIGDGPQRSLLESIAKQEHLEDKVFFLGYTNCVGDYLAAMDIYVNPTLDEGFGIAVVEAMLAKLPVILSNKGAHPELIVDGESGILYPGGEIKALVKKIEWLISNRYERIRIGKNGSKQAKERFSPRNYAENYIQAAEMTVNRNTPQCDRSGKTSG